jgi:hypothetical protein
MSKNNFLNSLVNGLGRKTGFTVSSRLTDGIEKKIYNPKSKFRKKIDRFELTGEFNSSIKKLRTLMEVFYEEYFINDLPYIQLGMYLENDIKVIENKVQFITNYITSDEQQNDYEVMVNMWNNIKSKL